MIHPSSMPMNNGEFEENFFFDKKASFELEET